MKNHEWKRFAAIVFACIILIGEAHAREISRLSCLLDKAKQVFGVELKDEDLKPLERALFDRYQKLRPWELFFLLSGLADVNGYDLTGNGIFHENDGGRSVVYYLRCSLGYVFQEETIRLYFYFDKNERLYKVDASFFGLAEKPKKDAVIERARDKENVQ